MTLHRAGKITEPNGLYMLRTTKNGWIKKESNVLNSSVGNKAKWSKNNNNQSSTQNYAKTKTVQITK
jgi:hypothetical protein